MKRKNKNFFYRNIGRIKDRNSPEGFTGNYVPLPPSYAPGTQPSRTHSGDSRTIQKAASSNVLEQHLFCYIYIWLNDSSEGYWAYPVMIDDDMLHAYIWDGYEWIYTYIYLSQITGFH